MTLRRLVEMIREDRAGANDWPVMFTSYRQLPGGEWQEVDNVREAVTTVEVDIESQEVLLIRDPARSALTVSSLEENLSGLMACHGEFTVDTCEPPIAVDGGGNFRIDLPIVGAGRDDSRKCYLAVFATSVSNPG